MADVRVQVNLVGQVVKVDTSRQLVFGWASIAKKTDGEVVTDSQADFMDDQWELEKMAYRYVLHYRDGGEMHERRGVARLVESMVFTPEKLEKMGLATDALPMGWWVGFKVDDPQVWASAEAGKFTGFSIGGAGIREQV